MSLDSWKLHQNRDVKDIASGTHWFFCKSGIFVILVFITIGQTQVYDLLLSPWRILECRQLQHCWALKSAHVSVSGLKKRQKQSRNRGEDTAFRWFRVPGDAAVFASESEESWTVWRPTTTSVSDQIHPEGFLKPKETKLSTYHVHQAWPDTVNSSISLWWVVNRHLQK